MSNSLRPDREPFAGRYRVLDGLDEAGGVFKARDMTLGRTVVLRILPEWPRARLAHLKAAAGVSHPNLASLLAFGVERETRYVVAQYVEGIGLDRAIRDRGPMPVDRVVDVLIQVALGLQEAHARGCIHGDLKPSKAILEPGGSVWVVGLGVSGTDGGRLVDDIGRLGGLLHFLLTGREPHPDRLIPEIRIHRPDVPTALAEVYRKLMGPRPEDRPRSMAEVVALLEACREGIAADRKPPAIGPEFDLSGLGIDPGPAPARRKPDRPVGVSVTGPERSGSGERGIPVATIAVGLVATAIVGAVIFRLSNRAPEARDDPAPIAAPAPEPIAPTVQVARTIYGGRDDARNWMLTSRRPVPRANVQTDGLNPHGSGSYLVVYRQKLGDFILDLDYRIGPDGDSGVFLRVGDLDDPVHTGVEVSITDRDGTGLEAPGAIRGLVAPATNARKPAGEWNHMTIAAIGSTIAVTLNGEDVSRIDLDAWTAPGKRPDGTTHGLADVALARLPRAGYLGFQDLVGDCWFREVVVRTPGPSR